MPLMLNPSTLIGCIYQILNRERGESQSITAKQLANCPPATSAELRAEISLKWESRKINAETLAESSQHLLCIVCINAEVVQ
jgi:hypothetical protein